MASCLFLVKEWIRIASILNLFAFAKQGYNAYGQLGLGNNESQNKPIKIMSDVTLLQNSVNIDSEW